MSYDFDAAARFMATHARLLDRRRFEVLFQGGTSGGAVAALAGYRNDDGGYGWGLEPDLRASESQPGGALHAFEVFGEIAPETSPRAVELCDWLASVSLVDGGLPFALPVSNPAGCAPFWAGADPSTSSRAPAGSPTAAQPTSSNGLPRPHGPRRPLPGDGRPAPRPRAAHHAQRHQRRQSLDQRVVVTSILTAASAMLVGR